MIKSTGEPGRRGAGDGEGARLTTAEAAARLGVKPETLYAYVSRGLIERRRGPGGSTYAAADIDRMASTGRRARDLPPLAFPSGLTTIEEGRCAYRGVDVVELAGSRSFEPVAEWLWTGDVVDEPVWPPPTDALDDVRIAQLPVPETATPLDRMRVTTAIAAALDPLRHDTSPTAATGTARSLLRLLVHGLPRADGAIDPVGEDAGARIAEVLWSRLSPLPATDARVRVLDAALVLLADHELAASTLAVRAAAMVRADPYEVVGAGLNVIGGVRHGGSSLLLEPLLRDASTMGVARALGERLRRDERVPGFGHPLYPDGDPRAGALLDRLDELDADPGAVRVVRDLCDAVVARGTPPPNVDLGLAGLAHAAAMVPGAGQAVFAVARTAGWIAHALEQYQQPNFLRARTIPR
jgi:citrate synthase